MRSHGGPRPGESEEKFSRANGRGGGKKRVGRITSIMAVVRDSRIYTLDAPDPFLGALQIDTEADNQIFYV